jgi:hypothetical protein
LRSEPHRASPNINDVKDGTEIYYVASATLGLLWHLRLNKGSTSAYKWEWLGGSELSSEVQTNQSLATTAYTSLGGPSIVAPLAGDYVLQWGGNVAPSQVQGLMTPKIGAAAPNDNDTFYVQSVSGNPWLAGMRWKAYTAIAAGTTIEIQYRASAAATTNFMNRWFFLRPRRVG